MRREPRRWVAIYRVGFGLLAIGTVIFLIIHNNRVVADWRLANFLSFFTIQSNLFAAVLLIMAGLGLTDAWPARRRDLWRGAAVLYMATTGLIYGTLLAGLAEQLDTNVPWADTVVHRVMPIVLIVDWLIDPPHTRLTFRQAVVWVIYPLVFAVYTLMRGPFADWYPYPFLDPRQAGGYGAVAIACVGITIFVLIATWLIVALGQEQQRFRQLPGTPPDQPGTVEELV